MAAGYVQCWAKAQSSKTQPRQQIIVINSNVQMAKLMDSYLNPLFELQNNVDCSPALDQSRTIFMIIGDSLASAAEIETLLFASSVLF